MLLSCPATAMVPEGYSFSGVRELYGKVPDPEMALAAYAVRIIDFDRSTRFCGRCGHETRPLRTERAKLCTDCNLITYPRISPAIIVLIKKGEEVLLARSPRFPPNLFSVIAGFVEPGESIEETVHREVKEEVGIRVKNIRYFGSEPWPFPDSLMLGFVADYAGGEIVIDNNEIKAAGWFTRDNLPDPPVTHEHLPGAHQCLDRAGNLISFCRVARPGPWSLTLRYLSCKEVQGHIRNLMDHLLRGSDISAAEESGRQHEKDKNPCCRR